MAKYVAAFICVFLILQGQASEGQEQPTAPKAEQLNGQWDGTPPQGGVLELTIEVIENNKIDGRGIIRGGGRKAARPSVSGQVEGKNVIIETYFPATQARVRYRCVWEERDTLQCKGPKGFEATFKRRQ